MDPRLLVAVESGKRTELRLLVEGNRDLFSGVTPHGNTVLHLALLYGRVELAHEILSHCSDELLSWKATNIKGETPLHYAAASSSPGVLSFAESVLAPFIESHTREEVLELLMAKDVEGNTALSIAAAGGRANLVKSMLDIHGELSMVVNEAGESAIYMAAVGGRRNVVSILLDFPYPPGNRGPHCRSILHAAVRNCDLEIALDIVGKMPELTDEADVFGCTPLHYAVSSGYLELVNQLLNYGSSAAYTLSRNGRSPLHEAVEMGLIEVVRSIVNHHRDSMEVLDSRGKNVLHIAVESGKQTVIDYILQETSNGKHINQRDTDGNTPLHLASIHCNVSALVALLTDHRARLFIENHAGQTFIDVFATEPTSGKYIEQRRFLEMLRVVFPPKPSMAKTLINKKIKTLSDSARHLYRSRKKKISIVATLISTVTFAAGLTAPGGFVNSGANEGTLALARTSALKAFMIFDTLALCISLLLVSTACLKSQAFETSFKIYLVLTRQSLTYSLIFVVLAFGTGVYAVMASRSHYLAIFVLFMCCAVTLILILSSGLPTFFMYMWKRSRAISKYRSMRFAAEPTGAAI